MKIRDLESKESIHNFEVFEIVRQKHYKIHSNIFIMAKALEVESL